MKIVAITSERQCEIHDVPQPHARNEFAVVKIHSVPMCTEYKAYKSGYKTDCLGHEAAGEVVEVDVAHASACGPRLWPHLNWGDRVVVMPQYPCGVCPYCAGGDYIHCQHNRDLKE